MKVFVTGVTTVSTIHLFRSLYEAKRVLKKFRAFVALIILGFGCVVYQ
jgi:hypothetical protein